MDSEKHTNRKGFLKNAGLALAGLFAFTSTSKGAASQKQPAATDKSRIQSEFSRIRPAKGAVEYKA